MKGRVLVIAGSDSGGGAGIQADIKAVMAMGGYAATAITALTAQNTCGVYGVMPVPTAFIRRQMQVVLADLGADAVKTGMLGDAETVEAVADELLRLAPGVPLVVDPVMVAKGGFTLLAGDAVAAMRERLLPIAALLTPNIPEAEALLGHAIPDHEAALAAAEALLQTGAQAVLLKGGHGAGPVVRDVLAYAGGVLVLEMERLNTRNTHGTGCTLASAVAAGLAAGMPLIAAVRRARAYVQHAIRHAPGLGAGHGPLGHGVSVDAGRFG